MKSIHAFSALLPGHGARRFPGLQPAHAYEPAKPGCSGENRSGGIKVSAISTLLTVALFQRGPALRRMRD